MALTSRILMKSGWFVAFFVGIVSIGVNSSHAVPITVTSIEYRNTADVKIFGSTGRFYTEYHMNTDEYGRLDAFCVDPAGNEAPYDYALIQPGTLVDSLAQAIAAAYYSGSGIWNKEVTQILIWEAQFDDTFDLTDGNFKYYGGAAILDPATFSLGNLPVLNVPLALAISPSVGGPGPSQDYLVSVPDASIMFLLGPALIGLGIVGRRKNI